jgi:transcriptional regulator with XRE-family HTH domain
MTTKLNNMEINPEYGNLFSFADGKERTEHNAQMISFRILSEVEKACEEKNIKKKDLAEMVGTSRSYITQLFRGNKQVNTFILAKIEEALDLSFDIKVRFNSESHSDFIGRQLTKEVMQKKRLQGLDCIWYCLPMPQSSNMAKNILSEKKSRLFNADKAA